MVCYVSIPLVCITVCVRVCVCVRARMWVCCVCMRMCVCVVFRGYVHASLRYDYYYSIGNVIYNYASKCFILIIVTIFAKRILDTHPIFQF